MSTKNVSFDKRAVRGPRLFWAATVVLVMTSPVEGQGLSAADSAIIDAGRQIVIVEKVPSSRWPRVTVRQFIDATPEEAAAVFADYERHVLFLPNVRHSKISRVLDSATVEVDYVLDVPLVSDESYTVRDHLTSDSTVGPPPVRTYQVAWTLVRASSTKAADGAAHFAPYREGTLMTYRNLVVPGSRLAGLGFIRGRAQREVEATARAIAEQVAKQRTGDRALLDSQIRALRAMIPEPQTHIGR
jgi:hypothetical protein